MARYAELHTHTNYSFLDGASHPYDLVTRAAELGYTALADASDVGRTGRPSARQRRAWSDWRGSGGSRDLQDLVPARVTPFARLAFQPASPARQSKGECGTHLEELAAVPDGRVRAALGVQVLVMGARGVK